jgi:beta-lactam-binding protein with PASTA domain
MRKVLAAIAAMAVLVAIGAMAAPAAEQSKTSVRVPKVTGLRLDNAEIRLMGSGLRYKEHGGGFFGIVVPHNWQVCVQLPRSGARVAARTRVQLYVSRPGQC